MTANYPDTLSTLRFPLVHLRALLDHRALLDQHALPYPFTLHDRLLRLLKPILLATTQMLQTMTSHLAALKKLNSNSMLISQNSILTQQY